MNLNETLAFVTVAESGSFTAAALKLGAPKSTLSRQVSRLEERLGARLLQRTTRKLSLTELGEAYFERCRAAIEDIEEAQRLALDVSGTPRGRLRVSLPIDLGSGWMDELLPIFRERYPDIEVEVLITQARVDLVAEGIDVALRGGSLTESGFVARKIAESSLVLCASPEYLDRRGRPQTVEDLAAHDAVVMGGARGIINRLEGPDGPVKLPFRPVIVVNEWGFLRTCILAGQGLGPMMVQTVYEDLKAGRLERVLPELGSPAGGLYAVYPSRHHLTPKVRVFVDFVVETIGPRFEVDLGALE